MIELTNIDVALSYDEGKLKAYVNITINHCFVVRGLKVIQGRDGQFVAMPNKQGKNGVFRDVAHPINSAAREMIEMMVMHAYEAEKRRAMEEIRDDGRD